MLEKTGLDKLSNIILNDWRSIVLKNIWCDDSIYIPYDEAIWNRLTQKWAGKHNA